MLPPPAGVEMSAVGDLQAVLTLNPQALSEGEEVLIHAQVSAGGNPAEGLIVTARFSNGEDRLTLNDMTGGRYEGRWTPSCAGEVQVDLHAAACPSGVLALKVVQVGEGAAKKLSVPAYGAGGTAWDWASALSGVLQYHGRNVKPWTIAAALGADPSEGLDLRRAGAVTEPSLASLLTYLRNGLGVLVAVEGFHGSESAGELPCRIRRSIRAGTPLWLAYGNSVTGQASVLVVAGVETGGVWIQDPVDGASLLEPLAWNDFTRRVLPAKESRVILLEILSVARPQGGLSFEPASGDAWCWLSRDSFSGTVKDRAIPDFASSGKAAGRSGTSTDRRRPIRGVPGKAGPCRRWFSR